MRRSTKHEARSTQNEAVVEETNARAACVRRDREREREDTDIRTEKMGRWVDERGCNVAIVFCLFGLSEAYAFDNDQDKHLFYLFSQIMA